MTIVLDLVYFIEKCFKYFSFALLKIKVNVYMDNRSFRWHPYICLDNISETKSNVK